MTVSDFFHAEQLSVEHHYLGFVDTLATVKLSLQRLDQIISQKLVQLSYIARILDFLNGDKMLFRLLDERLCIKIGRDKPLRLTGFIC